MIRDQMPQQPEDWPEDGCDIVVVILRRVIALSPAFDRETAARIEAEVREAYGGLRVRIPKRGKHLTPQQRRQVFEEALTSVPTDEILRKHKISGRSLRRWLKQGGG